mgnify:CR=1 FL=1
MRTNEKICELRDKLQSLILNGADYLEICKASEELDRFIMKYYLVANTCFDR